jgi:hypothetical protein
MTARPDPVRRSIIIDNLPKPIPTTDQRATLHRELDAALDAIAAADGKPVEPEGPGRIADMDEGEP